MQGASTAKDIDRLRDGYRPAAKRGAILFFVLSDLASVNSMYQYSLSTYLEVFSHSLKKSQPHSYLPKRLGFIKDTLTFNVYNYGCTGALLTAVVLILYYFPPYTTCYLANVSAIGIFEMHKLLFSFQITMKIQQHEGDIKQAEIDFLIKVPSSEWVVNKLLGFRR